MLGETVIQNGLKATTDKKRQLSTMCKNDGWRRRSPNVQSEFVDRYENRALDVELEFRSCWLWQFSNGLFQWKFVG